MVDFCKGEPLSINQLIEEAARALGVKNLKIHHTGESKEYISFHASPQGMKKLFGFEPKIPLSEGIKKFAEYVKQNV